MTQATIKSILQENDKFIKYGIELEGKLQKINIFENQLTEKLSIGTVMEVEKNKSGYWSFVSIVSIFEDSKNYDHLESNTDNIPTADEYLENEKKKYDFGMAAKTVISSYLHNASVIDLKKDKSEIKKRINEVFLIIGESRKECL